jgi:hypothetical protein
MRDVWRTIWQGNSIVFYRGEDEVERLHADSIRRVVFVQDGPGYSAGDVSYAIVETDEECYVLPGETGFAGAVAFERQSFWAGKQCVYWTDGHGAMLPSRCRSGLWGWSRSVRFTRMPREDVAGVLETWALEGPQTWDERKWQRIERSRPFSQVRASMGQTAHH